MQTILYDFQHAHHVKVFKVDHPQTEWCYNYHEPSNSYALRERGYPRVEEQHRFIKAYVQHRPFRPSLSTQSSSTSLRPMLSHSVSNFMLDSRSPPAQAAEEEKGREERVENEVRRLMHEARIWRPANSAMWVAWGIVQAKVDGMDEALHAKKVANSHEDVSGSKGASGEPLAGSSYMTPESKKTAKDEEEKREEEAKEAPAEGAEADDEEETGFDYLGYAQERAMFFWGDMLQMGLVENEELPEDVRAKAKLVDY